MMCCCSYVEGMCHSQQELGGGPTPPHTRYFPTLIFLPPPLSFGRTHAMRKKAAAADYSDIICVNVRNFFLPLPTYRMDTFSALYLFHFPLICQSETSPLTFRASGNIWQQEKKEEEKENKKKTGNVTFFCRVLFFLSLFPQTDALFALLFLNLFFFPPPPRRFVPKVSAVLQGWVDWSREGFFQFISGGEKGGKGFIPTLLRGFLFAYMRDSPTLRRNLPLFCLKKDTSLVLWKKIDFAALFIVNTIVLRSIPYPVWH